MPTNQLPSNPSLLLSSLTGDERIPCSVGGASKTLTPNLISRQRVFDVGSYTGADPIASAIADAAAATPRGCVYIPRGTWETDGLYDIGGMHGLTISGEGEGTVIDIAHATNDLFLYSTFSGGTKDITLRNFKVTSSVARTSGWVFRGTAAYNDGGRVLYNSRFANIAVEKQESCFWFPGYINVWVTNCFLHDFVGGAGGIGIKAGQTAATSINQGADLHFTNVAIMGQNAYTSSGAGATLLSYAWHIEDCDAVYMNNCTGLGVLENVLTMVAGGYGLHAHQFRGSVFDVTRNGHVIRMTGTTPVQWVTFNDCWISAGGFLTGGAATCRGMSIEAEDCDHLKIQNSRIRANKATGIYITTPNANEALIENNDFSENGGGATASDNHNIVVDVGSGQVGPTIIGNKDSYVISANGVGLRTTANSVKITARNNVWPSGWTYGATPQASSGNRGSVSTTTRSDGSTTQTAADTVETDLWTEVVPADALSRDNQAIRVTAWGGFAANTNIKTLRFYAGTDSFTVNDATTAPNGVQWKLEVLIVRTGASAGKRIRTAMVGGVFQGTGGNAGLTDSWASSFTLKITGQNAVATLGDIKVHHVLYEPILDC